MQPAAGPSASPAAVPPVDTAALVQMTAKVQGGADPRAVAEEWLTANPLGR
jgi:ABC-type proline/glycine betaine transport system substrate-binding protein